MKGVEDPDEILRLQILNERQTPNGIQKTWENHDRLPLCSLRTLITRFLDITSAPSKKLLAFLAECCDDMSDRYQLKNLANETACYDSWRESKLPDLVEVFEQFPSCRPPASLLVAHLTPLQPRFYSISSSQKKYPKEIHLTVGVVQYQNEGGTYLLWIISRLTFNLILDGKLRYGVCSNYLSNSYEDDDLYLFLKSAPGFHIPDDFRKPIILVGPGTGIAPFRGFLQEIDELKQQNPTMNIPRIWLFFGCRTKQHDLYYEEKEEMLEKRILHKTFLALSRDPNTSKANFADLNLVFEIIN